MFLMAMHLNYYSCKYIWTAQKEVQAKKREKLTGNTERRTEQQEVQQWKKAK